MQRRPLVGVTADIEWHARATPARLHYEVDAHLTGALHEAGATVIVLPHEEPEASKIWERLDAVVLSGGAWMFPNSGIVEAALPVKDQHKHRRAQFELSLARWALQQDRPLLGICGGFQVLNAAAGGTLDTNLAAGDPVRALHAGPDRSHAVHAVSPVPGTQFAALVGERDFAVNSQHRQGIAAVGAGARACAHADDGLVEAIECPGRRFCIGVQWHPEFLLGESDRALLRGFVAAALLCPATKVT